jgi:hypothetical protein
MSNRGTHTLPQVTTRKAAAVLATLGIIQPVANFPCAGRLTR